MFDFFKKGEDFYSVRQDNVTNYISEGKLEYIFLVSPLLGGSTGMDNQIVVTPSSALEKKKIDDELINALKEGKSVKDFKIDLNYKERSIVPANIIVKATINGRKFKKVIRVW